MYRYLLLVVSPGRRLGGANPAESEQLKAQAMVDQCIHVGGSGHAAGS
jgi:hypothetical protein